MPRYEFEVHLEPEVFVRVYRGTLTHVLVRATTGKTIQLAAAKFRPFVTAQGVHGHFVLTCDEHHRAIDLRRA